MIVNHSIFGDLKRQGEGQSESVFEEWHNAFELFWKHRSIVIFYIDCLISILCPFHEIRLAVHKSRDVRDMNWYQVTFFCRFKRKSVIIATSSLAIEWIASICDPKSVCHGFRVETFYYLVAEHILFCIVIEERNSKFIKGGLFEVVAVHLLYSFDDNDWMWKFQWPIEKSTL